MSFNSRLSFLRRALVNHRCQNAVHHFLHIPKTGGTHLGRLERWGLPVAYPIIHLGHAVFVRNKADLRRDGYPPVGFKWYRALSERAYADRFVFTIVRNPFDWLVSYAGHAGGWAAKYKNRRHYDYHAANRPFPDFVRLVHQRRDRWPWNKALFFQIFSSAGRLMTDYILKTESLDHDLRVFCQTYGLRYRPATRQRVGTRKDYRSYYDDRSVQLVYDMWGKEMDLFGYDFDGSHPSRYTNVRIAEKSFPHTYDVFRDEWSLV